jgi:hypothetical protein
VYPSCEAGDAGVVVYGLHRSEGLGALGGAEIALKNRVVVDAALGLGRKDRGGDTRETVYCGTGCAAGVLLPRGEQSLGSQVVQGGVAVRMYTGPGGACCRSDRVPGVSSCLGVELEIEPDTVAENDPSIRSPAG